jgi:hypothetical protein
MAFRFCDSFDHYSDTEILRKWTVASACNISAGGGRNSTNGLKITSSGAISKTLDHQTGFIVGAAFAFDEDPFTYPFHGVSNDITGIATVVLNGDHTMTFSAGSFTQVSSFVMNVGAGEGVFNYVEMKIINIANNPITLDYVVRVNGETVLSGTGAATGINPNTFLSQSSTANVVAMGSPVNDLAHVFIDDYYCCDSTVDGFGHNDFLGDVRIGFVVPASDVTTNFSVVGGAGGNSFSAVNEAPPDYDTSYIYDASVAATDEFTYQAISSFAGTLVAVQYLTFCRKDDEGSKSFKQTIGGMAFGTQFWVSDFYFYYINALDSNGGSAWTVSNFNSQTFGLVIEV